MEARYKLIGSVLFVQINQNITGTANFITHFNQIN